MLKSLLKIVELNLYYTFALTLRRKIGCIYLLIGWVEVIFKYESVYLRLILVASEIWQISIYIRNHVDYQRYL